MERLTQTSNSGGVAFTFDLDITCQPSEARKILNLATKLKDYEDLEEQGRLIKLPCKVGNTVYRYVEEKGCVLEYIVWNISMSAYESGGIDIVIEGCAESEDEVEDEFSLS